MIFLVLPDVASELVLNRCHDIFNITDYGYTCLQAIIDTKDFVAIFKVNEESKNEVK